MSDSDDCEYQTQVEKNVRKVKLEIGNFFYIFTPIYAILF